MKTLRLFSRSLTRLGLTVAMLAVVVVGLAVPSRTGAAPAKDTFYLSWPYEAPPKGNLNDFSPDAAANYSGIGAWAAFVSPTFAYYRVADGKYVGWLAKSWAYSTDGKKYTLTLRDDITWSDGTPITSKDVVDTYLLAQMEGGNGEYSYGLDSVKAVDAHTIDFMLNKPPSIIFERLLLLDNLSAASVYGVYADRIQKALDDAKTAGTALADLKKSDVWTKIQADLEAFRPDHVLSSGGYTVAAADVTESQMVLHRTDKTPFGRTAKFDKIVIYHGDTDVSTPLLLTGDLYYDTDYFPPATEKTLTDKGIKIIRAPSDAGPGLLFNDAVYPLGRADVRQAIAYAIDRTRVTKVSYGQIGQPVKYMTGFSDSHVADYLTPDAIKGLNTYDYSLDKATAILNKAGFKKNGDQWVDDKGNDMSYELSYPSDYTDYVPAAQDVASQLSDFGIKITLRGVPDEQHRPSIRDGKFQLAIRLAGYPNPLPFYAYRYLFQQNSVGGSAKVGTGFADLTTGIAKVNGKDVDLKALLVTMSTGTDPAPQKAAVTTAAQLFNDQLPIIPLVERYYNCPLITTNINGVPPDSDPIWQNVGSGNAIAVLILDGTLSPKP